MAEAVLIINDALGRPVPVGPPEPTPEELIAQLRSDLLAERAWSLRLEDYIDEVLDADLPPENEPVAAWEADDFVAYWAEEAKRRLDHRDYWRRIFCARMPVPVMGIPKSDGDPQPAA